LRLVGMGSTEQQSYQSVTHHLEIHPQLTRKLLVEFIRNETRKFGFEKVVLGLSGGIDSALSATLAAEALGPENVTALMLPYKTSSPKSEGDARLLIEQLGLPHDKIEITQMAEPLFAHYGEMSKLRRGNALARLRMIVIFDRSMAENALVLGTSNKTEYLLGYTTWYRRPLQNASTRPGEGHRSADPHRREAPLRRPLARADRRDGDGPGVRPR
jgi:hypothetical protein